MAETKRQFSGRQQESSGHSQRDTAYDQNPSEFAHRIHFYPGLGTFYLKWADQREESE